MLDADHQSPGGEEPTFVGLVSTGSGDPVRTTALLRAADKSMGSFLTALGGDMDEVLLWAQQGIADSDVDPWLRLPISHQPVVSLASEALGGRLAAAAQNVVSLWDISTATPSTVPRELQHDCRVDGVKVLQQNTLVTLARGSSTTRLNMWDLRQQAPACQIL